MFCYRDYPNSYLNLTGKHAFSCKREKVSQVAGIIDAQYKYSH